MSNFSKEVFEPWPFSSFQPFSFSVSLSLCDGGGVCARGLPVRVPASACRFYPRYSVLHAGVSWRKEESGPVLLIARGGTVLGQGHPNSQRPCRQHEPEGEAWSISFSFAFSFYLLTSVNPRGKVLNLWFAGSSVCLVYVTSVAVRQMGFVKLTLMLLQDWKAGFCLLHCFTVR